MVNNKDCGLSIQNASIICSTIKMMKASSELSMNEYNFECFSKIMTCPFLVLLATV